MAGSRAVLAVGACLLAAQGALAAWTWQNGHREPPAPAPVVEPPPPPLPPEPPPPPPPPQPPPPPPLPDLEQRIQETVARVAPALLHIENRKVGGVGSGFVIDAEGHALSNAHVVGEARDVRVMLYDGHKVTAKVLARDYAMDLALVKLDLRNAETAAYVKPLPLGDSDALRVGQMVMTLGSPHSLSRSVAFGIVSNTRRGGGILAMPRGGISGLMNLFIQTDAPINPGNSGGPLVTLAGEVVGVNSRGYPNSDGLGLAIPINTAKGVLDALKAAGKANGQMERNVIGADLSPFDPGDDDLPWGYKIEQGVKVAMIFPDSPAAAAGLEKGDVIVKIAGQAVNAHEEEDLPAVYRLIDTVAPETPFEIVVQREAEAVLTVKGMSALAFYQSVRIPQIGLYARAPYDDEVRGQRGAVVTGRIEEFPGFDRDAEDQFQVGDVVKRVEGVPVQSFEAFYDQIRSAHGPVPAKLFEVIRGRKTVMIPFPFEKRRRAAAKPEEGGD